MRVVDAMSKGLLFCTCRQLTELMPNLCTLAIGEGGAVTEKREKSVKNLLNFNFPCADSGIDWQCRFEPVDISWKWKSGAQSARASHRILRRKQRFLALTICAPDSDSQ